MEMDSLHSRRTIFHFLPAVEGGVAVLATVPRPPGASVPIRITSQGMVKMRYWDIAYTPAWTDRITIRDTGSMKSGEI